MGKSTLADALALNGLDWSTARDMGMIRARCGERVQPVFQDPATPASIRVGRSGGSWRSRWRICWAPLPKPLGTHADGSREALMAEVGLPADAALRLPSAFLGRAAATDRDRAGDDPARPALVVLDEAVSGARSAPCEPRMLITLLAAAAKRAAICTAYLFIAHDMALVRTFMADRAGGVARRAGRSRRGSTAKRLMDRSARYLCRRAARRAALVREQNRRRLIPQGGRRGRDQALAALADRRR